MELQKLVGRKVGKKKYYKYVVVIPPDKIKTLGWKSGEKLMGSILHDGEIILRRAP